MSRTIICTVGTSLLTNRDDRPWTSQKQQGGNLAADALPHPKDVQAWLNQADPVKASAELHTLHRLVLEPMDRLIFYYSDTPQGKFCAEQLQEYFKRKKFRAESKCIQKLGYDSRPFAAGLKALVGLTIEDIRRAREHHSDPVLCATGGFKSQTAILNLIGTLLKVEVVYLYEDFTSLITLPPLPLQWDCSLVRAHREFFNWIDAEPRTAAEAESWLQASPELRNLTEKSDDNLFLSVAGDLMFRVAKEQDQALDAPVSWPAASDRLPEDKVQVANIPHARPAGWERFVDRLTRISIVTAVRYDEAMHTGDRVRLLDAATGSFGVRFEAGDKALPLRVETTSSGAAQCELVLGYLRRLK